MKSKFFSHAAIALLCIAITSSIYAQEQTLPPVTVTTTSNVNKAVSKSFQSTFKEATNAQWYKVDRDYLASFMMNDQKNHALFQKNGYLIYRITYGKESNMPDDVRKIVKTSYLDYNITSAINVKESGRNIWVVNLETDKKLILARVEDGELEEVGNYDKSM